MDYSPWDRKKLDTTEQLIHMDYLNKIHCSFNKNQHSFNADFKIFLTLCKCILETVSCKAIFFIQIPFIILALIIICNFPGVGSKRNFKM